MALTGRTRKLLRKPMNSDSVGLGSTIVSPAVVFLDNQYLMWYVDVEDPRPGTHRTVAFSTSDNGMQWQDKIHCNMIGHYVSPWHIDVQFIDNVYYMVVYDLTDISLWKSDNMLDFNYIKTLLSPSEMIGSFYNGLYRASLVKADDKYRLYFSANDAESTYIGLMEGDSVENMEIVSYNNGRFSSFPEFIRKFIASKRVKYTFIISNWYKTHSRTTKNNK